MGRLIFGKIAIASLMLATAAVRAQTPTYLYGTPVIKGVGQNIAIATTTPTASNPRAAYVFAAVTSSGVLNTIAWADTTSSLVQIGDGARRCVLPE